MNRRKVLALLLAALFCLAAAGKAFAMSSAEKEEKYQAAVLELEAYLESGGEWGSADAIANAFDELRGYQQSKGYYSYAVILGKIADETYDDILYLHLEILEYNETFQKYLENRQETSAMGSVEQLKAYVAGRKAEHDDDQEEAKTRYLECMGFFDTEERYADLKMHLNDSSYNKALRRKEAGDYAGAWWLLKELRQGYRDRETIMKEIEGALGYQPANAKDNPGSVDTLEVTNVLDTEVSLKWDSPAHATDYVVTWRRSGTPGKWSDETVVSGNTFTIEGLEADTAYDFSVTARAGQVLTEHAVLTDQRTMPLLQAVNGLKVTKVTTNSISISWNAPAYADYYIVLCKQQTADTWQTTRWTDDPAFLLEGLEADTMYELAVTVVVNNVSRQSSSILERTEAIPVSRFNTPSPYFGQPVDIGIPDLNGKKYARIFSSAKNDSYDMNIYIYWVQVQLKKLGDYKGDLTGLFDNETNSAVGSFMQKNGRQYANAIDQAVIDFIAEKIGSQRVAVKYGGFYHGLDSLTENDSQTGNMSIIWSNRNQDKYGSTPNRAFISGGAYWVQTCLERLNLYSNNLDGKFGEATDKAVQDFERRYEFREKPERRVYVTYGEARKMLELCYQKGIDVSQLKFDF